ncbi:hypothetical protein EGT74_24300 [Chitinophaga lutea]|uniref:DUF4136 domain-containing protein n=1 Tax=Chitinophaga lutea TaxID=2488634 RepID=A0A3N4PG68_9BACT|nr:hypothetical protein [Chitinophaga lutea]RPE05509.1 hypothetical protein EGT74_24300 [Chitinophaga lutea]
MKYLTLLMAFLLTFSVSSAQKTYAWCADEIRTKPRIGFLQGDTIDVVIFDGRNLEALKRNGCEEGQLAKNLQRAISQTYPQAVFNILTSEKYPLDAAPDRITIKVGIVGYHAAYGTDITTGFGTFGGNFSYGVFPSSSWNAITAYSLKVYDKRNGTDLKKTKDISKTESTGESFGFKSAKKILDKSFTAANQELFFFIDECFMK